ncbi:hypothetical protein ES332_D01G188500v1 [Gossypium tomentosum]|uniref:Uncharacterized protein n=1 Tax=Gossypium tomentosum TaxID=34277 RepID=A0A5D2MBG5_GOSTO|nr:hypothetical protein ES332_D01G188500v1 [Gossypium tomentosum]
MSYPGTNVPCAVWCSEGNRMTADSSPFSDDDREVLNPVTRYGGQLVYGGGRTEACVACEGITRVRSGSKGSSCVAAAAEGFQKP